MRDLLRRAGLATLAASALACGASPPADFEVGAGGVAGWPAYGGTPGGGHYSTATPRAPMPVGDHLMAFALPGSEPR